MTQNQTAALASVYRDALALADHLEVALFAAGNLLESLSALRGCYDISSVDRVAMRASMYRVFAESLTGSEP